MCQNVREQWNKNKYGINAKNVMTVRTFSCLQQFESTHHLEKEEEWNHTLFDKLSLSLESSDKCVSVKSHIIIVS